LEKGILRYYDNKADYDAGRQCIKGTTINATLAAFRDDDDVSDRRSLCGIAVLTIAHSTLFASLVAQGDYAFLITSKQPGVHPHLFRASSEEERRSWQEVGAPSSLEHIVLVANFSFEWWRVALELARMYLRR
jgi:hypothetical protein